MRVEYCMPTKADAEYVAEHIRPDNKTEIIASIGDNALDDILRGIKLSIDVGCYKVNGKPVCIFGVLKKSVLDDGGLIWLYFTDDIDKHKLHIAKETKKGLAVILEKYGKVYNWCNVGNKRIMRWIEWLGADIKGPYPYGVWGIPHYYFEFRRGEK